MRRRSGGAQARYCAPKVHRAKTLNARDNSCGPKVHRAKTLNKEEGLCPEGPQSENAQQRGSIVPRRCTERQTLNKGEVLCPGGPQSAYRSTMGHCAQQPRDTGQAKLQLDISPVSPPVAFKTMRAVSHHKKMNSAHQPSYRAFPSEGITMNKLSVSVLVCTSN